MAVSPRGSQNSVQPSSPEERQWSQNDSGVFFSKPASPCKQATDILLSIAASSLPRDIKSVLPSRQLSKSASPTPLELASTALFSTNASIIKPPDLSSDDDDEAVHSPYLVQVPSMSAENLRRSYSQDSEMTHLLDDTLLMLGGASSRWKMAAVTMPRSLWKGADSADKCNLGLQCERPLGHFVAGYRIPSFVKSDATGGLLRMLITTNRGNHCWRCGDCFCEDHTSNYATLVLDEEDAPVVSKAVLSPVHDLQLPASGLQQQLERPFLPVKAGSPETPQRRTSVLPTASSALAQCLARHAKPPSYESPHEVEVAPPFSCHGPERWSNLTSSVDGSSQASLLFNPVGTSSPSDRAYDGSSVSGAQEDSWSTAPAYERGSTPSQRMAVLPDGRYLVRERVCDRCHIVVQRERSKTILRQATRRMRREEEEEEEAALATLATVAGLVDYCGEGSANAAPTVAFGRQCSIISHPAQWHREEMYSREQVGRCNTSLQREHSRCYQEDFNFGRPAGCDTRNTEGGDDDDGEDEDDWDYQHNCPCRRRFYSLSSTYTVPAACKSSSCVQHPERVTRGRGQQH